MENKSFEEKLMNREEIEMMVSDYYENPQGFQWRDNGDLIFYHQGKKKQYDNLNELNITIGNLQLNNAYLNGMLKEADKNFNALLDKLFGSDDEDDDKEISGVKDGKN